MECVEAAALKTSLRKETPLKSSTPQAVLEDIWVVNNAQNGVSCDDFSVDDLFDFTNGDAFLEQVHEHEHEVQEQQQEEASSHKRQKLSEEQDQEQHFSDDIVKFSDQELAVPADDVANLEWLSHFIEDSFSEHSSAVYPAGMLTATPKLPEPEKPVPTSHKTPVPGKARSKRTRTGGRVWSLVGSPPVTDSSSSSTSSSSSNLSGSGSGSVSGSSSAPWFLCSNSVLNSDSIFEVNGTEPVSVEKKKHKKRPVATELTGGNVTQPTRRCSHCGVTKTPQWRAGPMGAKTLCNACGVRFKSGRLLPEYRPACSPTFSTELHSNHHRKVIEMRRKKEGLNEAEPGSVPNFG